VADFVTHGLVGAGVMSAIGRKLNAPKWAKNSLAIYGFVGGILADGLDWLVAVLGIRPRWELYHFFHHDAPWWILINPPIFLHVKVTDPPFHIFPAWDWWSTMWSLEVLWVLFALSLLRYSYREEIILFLFWLKNKLHNMRSSP
jgi:hypothetical protein